MRVNSVDIVHVLQDIQSEAAGLIGQLIGSEGADVERINMASQAVVTLQTLAASAASHFDALQAQRDVSQVGLIHSTR